MVSFRHKPLNTKFREFRLIELQKNPSLGDAVISFTIESFSLESRPSYRALSYHWGPPSPTRTISVNQAEVEIRENLADFLEVLIQSPDAEGYYWIDQMCIDQNNVEERNHQVKQMRDIFRTADEVIVWLGASDVSSLRAMDVIQNKNVSCTRRSAHCSESNDTCGLPSHDLADITNLFGRPYFRRLWIVQEVMLAREVIIMCGTARLEWDRLKNFYFHALMGRPSLEVRPVRDLLLKRNPMTSDNWLSLYDALIAFGLNDCHEPRDKIFGLLGIVRPEDQLHIDYSCSVERLFEQAVDIALRSRVFRRQSNEFDIWPESAYTIVKHFDKLGKGMGVIRTSAQRESLRKHFEDYQRAQWTGTLVGTFSLFG